MKRFKIKIKFKTVIFGLLLVFLVLVALPFEKKLYVPKYKFDFVKEMPFIKTEKSGAMIDKTFNPKIKLGLDLSGGSRIVYSADLSKISVENKDNAMKSLQKVIENRINAFGVAEPVIYTSKSGNENKLTVELPGVSDLDKAMDLIGKTAQLEFKEGNAEGTDFVSTGLTGNDFRRADVAFDPNTNAPYIAIEFNDEGSKKFEEITGKNIGKPIAIYLDDKVISAPNVNQQISGGKAQITGQFEFQEAKDLAIQLNAGALPVPIRPVEQRTIDATLGSESVSKSVFAGMVGIALVIVFMVLYYRFMGVFSSIGIILYGVITIALIKLLGITLTMGGVAGLLLTIGTSVETDILIFERIREVLRRGNNYKSAINLGYKKTWPTLWDSNVVTLIIAALLYTVGGTVRGFALVLALGIFIGLFNTFVYTRPLMTLFANIPFFQKDWLFATNEKRKNK